MRVLASVRPVVTEIARRRPLPGLDVNRVTVRVPDLPPALQGYIIAQVSDIHVGDGEWGPQHLDQAAEAIRRANPDIVVNTGDFLEREPPLGRVRAVARRLTLPGQNRNFAVLGNPESVAGEEMVARLKGEVVGAGIRVLENELACLHRGEAELTLAGLSSEAPGWDTAVRRLGESGRPRVVLVHVPDCAERLPAKIADVILAGHTHGGQITLPGLEKYTVRAMCGSEFIKGMYDVNGSPLYVNRGLGCVGLPMRFRANPEVAILTLSR